MGNKKKSTPVNKTSTKDNKKKFGTPLVIVLCIIIALETITIAVGAGYLISQNSNNNNTDSSTQNSTTQSTDATEATEATLAVEEGKYDETINGIWKEENSTSDVTFFWTIENNSFVMEGGDGYGYNCIDYTVNSDADNKVMEIVSNGASVAVYNYSIANDKLTLELKTDTVTDSTDETSTDTTDTVTLVKVDKVDLPQISKRDDFKADADLTGKWENAEQGRTFEFKENGILRQESTVGPHSVYDAAYTYDGKTVFVYSTADDVIELSCTLNDGSLTLKDEDGNSLDFTKTE